MVEPDEFSSQGKTSLDSTLGHQAVQLPILHPTGPRPMQCLKLKKTSSPNKTTSLKLKANRSMKLNLEAFALRRQEAGGTTYRVHSPGPVSAPAWGRNFEEKSPSTPLELGYTEALESSRSSKSPESFSSFQSRSLSNQNTNSRTLSSNFKCPKRDLKGNDVSPVCADKSWVCLQTVDSAEMNEENPEAKAISSAKFVRGLTPIGAFPKLETSFKAGKLKTLKPQRRLSVGMIGEPHMFRHLCHASDAEQAEEILERWKKEGVGKFPEPRWNFLFTAQACQDEALEAGEEGCIEAREKSEIIERSPTRKIFGDFLKNTRLKGVEKHGEKKSLLLENFQTGPCVPPTSHDQTIVIRPKPRFSLSAIDFTSASKVPVAAESRGKSRSPDFSQDKSSGLIGDKAEKSIVKSFQTVEKIVSTKIFFERHYDAILKRPKDRDRRKLHIEKEICCLNLTEEERKDIWEALTESETAYLRDIRCRIGVDGFTKLKIIGHGAFGVVSLVREKSTGQLLAMKQMKKSDMLRRGQEGHVRAERDLMTAASSLSRWIIRLMYSFQDVDHLYLVMEYMGGGDMLNLLIERDKFPESMAKFYTAEMVLAIEEAHKLGYIHRDIKPDNFLFDREGHIKISDFGLATDFHWSHDGAYYAHTRIALLHKYGIDLEDGLPDLHKMDRTYFLEEELVNSARSAHNSEPKADRLLTIRDRRRKQMAHSIVGTNNYMAPEILKSKGYDHGCDWWSLGVILFEMLYGYPPFTSSSRQLTRSKILSWRTSLRFPPAPDVSRKANHLIQSLLCDRRERLGCKTVRAAPFQRHQSQRTSIFAWGALENEPVQIRNEAKGDDGAEEIKSHPWFQGIDFGSIHLQTPPFVPDLKGETDTRYFDDNIDPATLAAPGQAGDVVTTRDPLLKHGTHGDEILETRKRHAFAGYTFKRPRQDIFDPRKGVLMRHSTFSPHKTPQLEALSNWPERRVRVTSL
ncbi:hypothetical protein O181_006365 [Austropuccinia psidii MF-1]|uniref:non-specific serine/threonine protein kinase n=1 Tax=Austropuccinia psidii MF-1 TaxID=1389203 RepID=A0A9Q3BKW4_9BASI|nr:hypothetical protein [Austropuccinia psidii MF-1]